MKFIEEFKAFVMRGNVVDMAVGVIIGAAFGKIVSSLVADVLMPPIGLLIGGVDFGNLEWIMRAADGGKAAVTLKYGLFINNVINFVIMAFAIFMMIKGISALQRKEEAAPSLPPAPSKDQVLLAEIRDLLKDGQGARR